MVVSVKKIIHLADDLELDDTGYTCHIQEERDTAGNTWWELRLEGQAPTTEDLANLLKSASDQLASVSN